MIHPAGCSSGVDSAVVCSGKRFPSFCPIVSTFSLNLDMDAVEGGFGIQVSDLYGRRNLGGGWLRTSSFFFLLHFHCILYFLALVLKPPFWREFP